VVLAAVAIVGRGIVSPVDWLVRTLILSIAAAVLIRYGLIAAVATLTTYYVINNSPVTLDLSRWYAVTGLVVVMTVATAMLVSWRLALIRREAAQA
jgi:hypothetical protein